MINWPGLRAAARVFRTEPFDHCIVERFFAPEIAAELEAEFPALDAPLWHAYDNALERKRTCNDWNAFVVERLSGIFAIDPLYPDPGLNGGGWHAHGRGGKLNVHLDYAKHPKAGLARKLNLIVYLNSKWEEGWGGCLGLWKGDGAKPGALAKSVAPMFNRAIIFDTTQQSWHGLPEPIDCPQDQVRKSLAVYYLTTPATNCESRGKALFAPTAEQEQNLEVLELIERRARGVYA